MSAALEVSDSLSNAPEQIERAAKVIGRGARRRVFEAIYYHKAPVKTVDYIADRADLTRLRVLQEGRHLDQKGIVRQTKKDGDTAYAKIPFFHAHKKEILYYAQNPKKLARLPTKRRTAVVHQKVVTLPASGARVTRISIDDVTSFAKVKRIRDARSLPASMSEAQFKHGVQRIIGEPGVFTDWGGERSDLYTTRLRVSRPRVSAAFAFKGPGVRGKLVPGRMGKNGDQMLRLFQEDAEVYFVQHWREIDPTVVDLMRKLAIAKSVMTGKRIWYGIMDGQDSQRLHLAYGSMFRPKRSS